MAERRAVNKYYPNDWDPASGSINKLRGRAKKTDGTLTVRFEMPYNIWCLGCDNHIALGVRYNAEKRKVGNYYTSPVYQFKMKCRHCETHFIIQTDPGKFDYVILSGARRQALQTNEKEDDSIEMPQVSSNNTERRMTDAMSKLERRLEDKMKSEAQLPTLIDLKAWRSRWKDNFSANQVVRAQFRRKRRQIEKSKEIDNELLKRASLDISLATPRTCDKREAREMLLTFKRSKHVEPTKKSDILNLSMYVSGKPKESLSNSTKKEQ